MEKTYSEKSWKSSRIASKQKLQQQRQPLEIVEDFAWKLSKITHFPFFVFPLFLYVLFIFSILTLLFQFFFSFVFSFCPYFSSSFFFSKFSFLFPFFPFFHLLLLFLLTFFGCPSRRQKLKNSREILMIKMTIFLCENLICGPRWTGRVRNGKFEGDPAFMFAICLFIFTIFQFFSQKMFVFFSFKYVSLPTLVSKCNCTPKSVLHGDVVS